MRNWWKYLTVAMLLYVILFSFFVPLSPGIAKISPDIVNAGEVISFDIQGYNTQFPKNTHEISVWLTSDASTFCIPVERSEPDHLFLSVKIPLTLPSRSLTLYVQHADAYMMLPNAVHINNSIKGNLQTDSSCFSQNKFTGQKKLSFPNRSLLYETIRNLMFHVPMWFVMMLLMTISMVYSVRHLSNFNLKHDFIAEQAVKVGLIFAIAGLLTGSLWARFTWGHWWIDDTKLNGAAITTLIYFAYLILRNSIAEEQQRARIAAVYSIFAYVILMVMLMILPRLTDSLHPGNGGNPAFSKFDLDSTLRMVFYPAVLGWIGLSLWILQIQIRYKKIKDDTI